MVLGFRLKARQKKSQSERQHKKRAEKVHEEGGRDRDSERGGVKEQK